MVPIRYVSTGKSSEGIDNPKSLWSMVQYSGPIKNPFNFFLTLFDTLH